MGKIDSRRWLGRGFNFCLCFLIIRPIPYNKRCSTLLLIQHLSYLMDFGSVIYPLQTHFMSSDMFSLSWQNRSYGLALTGWNWVHLASSVYCCLVIPMVFKSLMLMMLLVLVSWSRGVMTHVHLCKYSPSLRNLKAVKDSGHHILYFWLLQEMKQLIQIPHSGGEMGWLEIGSLIPRKQKLSNLPLLFVFIH